jgi:hypothetical protein
MPLMLPPCACLVEPDCQPAVRGTRWFRLGWEREVVSTSIDHKMEAGFRMPCRLCRTIPWRTELND